jgi:hypothetical protein
LPNQPFLTNTALSTGTIILPPFLYHNVPSHPQSLPLTKTCRSQPLTHTVNSSSPQMVISYPFLHSKQFIRNVGCEIDIAIEKITLY